MSIEISKINESEEVQDFQIVILDALNLGSTSGFEGFLQDWVTGRLCSLLTGTDQSSLSVMNTDYILSFLSSKLNLKYASSEEILKQLYYLAEEGVVRPDTKGSTEFVGIRLLTGLNFHKNYFLQNIFEENDSSFSTKNLEEMLTLVDISINSLPLIDYYMGSYEGIIESSIDGSLIKDLDVDIFCQADSLKDKVIYSKFKGLLLHQKISQEQSLDKVQNIHTTSARGTLRIVDNLEKAANSLKYIFIQHQKLEAFTLIKIRGTLSHEDYIDQTITQVQPILKGFVVTIQRSCINGSLDFADDVIFINEQFSEIQLLFDEQMLNTFEVLVKNYKKRKETEIKVQKIFDKLIQQKNRQNKMFILSKMTDYSSMKKDSEASLKFESIQRQVISFDLYIKRKNLKKVFQTIKQHSKSLRVEEFGNKLIEFEDKKVLRMSFDTLKEVYEEFKRKNEDFSGGIQVLYSKFVQDKNMNSLLFFNNLKKINQIKLVAPNLNILDDICSRVSKRIAFRQLVTENQRILKIKASYNIFSYKILSLMKKREVGGTFQHVKTFSNQMRYSQNIEIMIGVINSLQKKESFFMIYNEQLNNSKFEPKNQEVYNQINTKIICRTIQRVTDQQNQTQLSHFFFILDSLSQKNQKLKQLFQTKIPMTSMTIAFSKLRQAMISNKIEQRVTNSHRMSVTGLQKTTALKNLLIVVRCLIQSKKSTLMQESFDKVVEYQDYLHRMNIQLTTFTYLFKKFSSKIQEKYSFHILKNTYRENIEQQRKQDLSTGFHYLEHMVMHKQKKLSIYKIRKHAAKMKYLEYACDAMDYIVKQKQDKSIKQNGGFFMMRLVEISKKKEAVFRLYQILRYKFKQQTVVQQSNFFKKFQMIQFRKMSYSLNCGRYSNTSNIHKLVRTLEKFMILKTLFQRIKHSKRSKNNLFGRSIELVSREELNSTGTFRMNIEQTKDVYNELIRSSFESPMPLSRVSSSKRSANSIKKQKIPEKGRIQGKKLYSKNQHRQVEKLQAFWKMFVLRKQYCRFRELMISCQRIWREKKLRNEKKKIQKIRKMALRKFRDNYSQDKRQNTPRTPESYASLLPRKKTRSTINLYNSGVEINGNKHQERKPFGRINPKTQQESSRRQKSMIEEEEIIKEIQRVGKKVDQFERKRKRSIRNIDTPRYTSKVGNQNKVVRTTRNGGRSKNKKSRMTGRAGDKENMSRLNNIDIYEKEYLERKVKNNLRRIRNQTLFKNSREEDPRNSIHQLRGVIKSTAKALVSNEQESSIKSGNFSKRKGPFGPKFY